MNKNHLSYFGEVQLILILYFYVFKVCEIKETSQKKHLDSTLSERNLFRF